MKAKAARCWFNTSNLDHLLSAMEMQALRENALIKDAQYEIILINACV